METKATTAISSTRTRPQQRRRQRVAAVLAGSVAAATSWLVIVGVAGIDLRAPVFDDSLTNPDVTLPMVIATSLLASVLGWIALAGLERFTTHARTTWTIVALAALLLSFGGPFGGSGTDMSDRWLLALMHVIVAATVIPLMRRTTSTSATGDHDDSLHRR